MEQLSNNLIEQRKKIKPPTDYIGKNDLSKFKLAESVGKTVGT